MAEAKAGAEQARAEAAAALKAHAAEAEAAAATRAAEERAGTAVAEGPVAAVDGVDMAAELGEAKAQLARLGSEAAARDAARDAELAEVRA